MQFILTLEQLGVIIAVISIVVGIILGLQSARDWATSRNMATFLQYQLQAFTSEYIQNYLEIISEWKWADFPEFWKKYGDPKNFAQFMSVGTVFDSMGVLLRKKYISAEMIPELMKGAARDFWLKVSPIVSEFEIAVSRPNTFQNIEYLYNEIQKLDESESS